ncbi:MAG: amidophosphoribosyltransferase, partial [Pseudomonadota bacterium]
GYARSQHCRYSTTGSSNSRDIQPFYADLGFSGVAIAHNGHLSNASQLRTMLVENGAIFTSNSDTEVILHLMARAHGTARERLVDALKQICGGYALVCMTKDELICVRDPNGIRPMVLGQLDGGYVIASETVAFDLMGAKYIRDINAGEMVVIEQQNKPLSFKCFEQTNHRPCLFEYVYFARPDSIVGGQNIYQVRKNIGAELAHESPCECDVIVPIPDSGTPAALGYATAANIPFDLGIIRSHYVGRSFIEPTQSDRTLAVRLKHNANRCVVENKRVVLVDDSLVRGTTAHQIVKLIRNAGATEVHMRIASPPVRYPCYYGIDMPNQNDLLAHDRDIKQMAEIVGVDSLAFISLDGLYRALGEKNGRNDKNPQFSDHYFSGDYPTENHQNKSNHQLSLLDEN